MSTATLPLRWELQNLTLGANTTNSFTATCSTIMSEGADEEDFGRGYDFSAANLADVTTATSPKLLIAMRPATTFNSITNRQTIVPLSYDVYSSVACQYEVHYSAVITGGTWVVWDVNSGVEINTNGTFVSAGRIIQQGFLGIAGNVNSRASASGALSSRMPIALDSTGTNQSRNLSLIMRNNSAGGVGRGLLNWRELR
jgi:hypothetical protein